MLNWSKSYLPMQYRTKSITSRSSSLKFMKPRNEESSVRFLLALRVLIDVLVRNVLFTVAPGTLLADGCCCCGWFAGYSRRPADAPTVWELVLLLPVFTVLLNIPADSWLCER